MSVCGLVRPNRAVASAASLALRSLDYHSESTMRALLAAVIGVAMFASSRTSAMAQETLTFDDAVSRAAEEGPTIDARRAAVEVAERSIGPAGRLPDPELTIGLNDVPVTGANAGSLTRDDFTMERIGIMQDVPNRSSRRSQTAIATAAAEKAHADLTVAGLEARLGAAQAWIALHFASRRSVVIDQLAEETHRLADATRGTYAAGGSGVDETVTTAIAAARLDDRKAETAAAVTTARAALHRWLGDVANLPVADETPAFHIDPVMLRDHLHHHPSISAFAAERSLAEANVALAQSDTRPDWAWEVSYGRRDPAFGDLASVGLRVGLPLFQGSRQKPIIAARRADVVRVDAEREATLREREAALEQRLAEFAALEANVSRAKDIRLHLARQRSTAAIGAHGAGTMNVGQLIAARTDALEAEIDLIDLEERLTLVGAVLTLEYGDTDQ